MALHSSALLFKSIVRRKLTEEIENCLMAARQGFDVWVKSPSPEVRWAFKELLSEEARAQSCEFLIATTLSDAFAAQECDGESRSFTPVFLVSEEEPPSGSGFVTYELPNHDKLVSSFSHAIQEILTWYKLEKYLDVFDSARAAKLKAIAKTRGLAFVIDAVRQVAYLAGYRGKDMEADAILENYYQEAFPSSEYGSGNSAEMFLNSVLSKSRQPHTFLKASLSYFVVEKLNNSLSSASRTLNISRTTLQEHLRLARQLNVGEILAVPHKSPR